MNARSAMALGASLLALALPTAAQASTLGGVTDGLGSTKVEAKVQINGPVEAKAKVNAKVKAKVNAKAGGTAGSVRRSIPETGRGSTTGVRTQVPPVKTDIRLKARTERVSTRARRAHGAARPPAPSSATASRPATGPSAWRTATSATEAGSCTARAVSRFTPSSAWSRTAAVPAVGSGSRWRESAVRSATRSRPDWPAGC